MNQVVEGAVIEREERFSRPEDRGAVVAQQPGGATSLLVAIERASANPAMDMDKMERLFAMHQKVVAQEAEAAFNAAMARAQARIEPVANNASNEQTHSRYAKLAAINKAIVPLYTAEGLSISFDSADSPAAGMRRTIAIVAHAQGHSRQHHIDLPMDDVGAKGNVNKTQLHAAGSTSSYARRYLVCMIFNVTTEDDNDGNQRKSQGKQMDEGVVADHIASMDECADLKALQAVFTTAYKAAQALGDRDAMGTLTRSKDARKAALAKKGGAS